MKINLKDEILDFEGKPVSGLDLQTAETVTKMAIEAAEETLGRGNAASFVQSMNKKQMKQHLTIGDVCRHVLAKGAENSKPDKKLECFNAGLKCVGDSADLTDKERQLIIALVDDFDYSALVYGRISALFEAPDPDDEDEEAASRKKKSKK